MNIRTITLVLAAASMLPAQDAPRLVVQQGFGVKVKDGLAGGAGTVQFVAGELAGGTPVKNAPYSAEAVTQTTQTLADGNRIARNSSSMIYRDSEGRERRELSLGMVFVNGIQSTPAQTIFISDPVAGVNYTLDTKNHTAMKMPPPPPLPRGVPGDNVMFKTMGVGGAMIPNVIGAPQVMIYRTGGSVNSSDQPAPKVEQLGTMNVEGVQAEGTRTTVTIPAGQIGNEQPIQIVSERWYSPELKVAVLAKHSDPQIGQTEYRLTNISRAEPLPSLFQVPPDYVLKDSPVFNYRVEKKQEDQ
jgi:hypothetical protein